jgi:hypothetical protein
MLANQFQALVRNTIWLHTLYRSEAMSEKHLIQAISARYKALPRRKRISDVREFAGRSAEDTKFFQKYFPDLYQEAFRAPASSADARSVATRPNKRAAKRR